MRLLHDLRLAARALRRRPGFTLAAAGTLALAIASVTVVFTVSNDVLLRPLAFPRPDRLAQVYERQLDRGSGHVEERGYFAWQNYADIREQVPAFSAITAWQYYDRTLMGVQNARRLAGRMVTPEFFRVFGVQPLLGRAFGAEDATEGHQRVAILGWGVWQNAFAGDAGIVGRTISLDGDSYAVVGVMPPGFDFPYDAQLWMPLVPFLGDNGEGARRFHRYRVAGRLADGATLLTARAELTSLADRLGRAFPETNADAGLRAVPLRNVLVGDARPGLRALSAAVAFLLLIACANIAGLMLARAVGRARDLGVRAALGASRRRLLTELLTESLLLALLGGVAGVMLAAWGLQAFLALVGDALPRAREVHMDGQALLLSLVVTVAAGLLFGILPAVRFSRDPSPALLRGGRSGAGDLGAGRLRMVLTSAQLALAFLLVSGAALLLNSFVQLQRGVIGVDPVGLLTMDVSLPEARYATPAQSVGFYDQLIARVQALPGVRAAAAGLTWPLGGSGWRNRLYIEGEARAEAELPQVAYDIVTPGWFRTSGIRLLNCTDVSARSDPAAQTVVINHALEQRWFAGREPIGRRVRFDPKSPWATIVGVAADVPPSLTDPPEPAVFVPSTLEPNLSLTLLVRAEGDAGIVAGAVRSALRSLDADVPVTRVATLDERLAESIAQPRYLMTIVALFAALALLLTCVGLYGVLAYLVGRRTRELGLRVAIGARPRNLLTLVLGEGVIMAAAGIAAGLAGALALRRAIATLLFHTSPSDPRILAGVALLVLAVTLLASWQPARRAARIDPMRALHSD